MLKIKVKHKDDRFNIRTDNTFETVNYLKAMISVIIELSHEIARFVSYEKVEELHEIIMADIRQRRSK